MNSLDAPDFGAMQQLLSDAMVAERATGMGRRGRRAAELAVPLIAFFFIQNAVSLASLAMVGRLGNIGLAGIGAANAVLAATMALLYGFDTAVQALVSRATGAGDHARGGRTLAGALCMAAPFGAGLCALMVLTAPLLVGALAPDHAVATAGSAFLRAAAPSLFFLSITIPFNAYWIGSARPQISFIISAIVAPVSVAATWLLVFGAGIVPALGAAGAGFASSASTLFGLLIQLVIGLRLRPVPVLFDARPCRDELATILSIGWPVSLQQSVVQLGFIVGFAIVSQVGVRSVAILNVLASLMMVPILMANGLGMACATLVGRALGRGDRADAAKWGWQLGIGAAVLVMPIALLVLFAPRTLLSLFLTDRETLAQAIWPAELLGTTISAGAFSWVLTLALRGAGATKVATGIPFLVKSAIELPLVWFVGIRLHKGFDGMVVVQCVLTFVLVSALALVWHRGRWARLGTLAPLRTSKASLQ